MNEKKLNKKPMLIVSVLAVPALALSLVSGVTNVKTAYAEDAQAAPEVALTQVAPSEQTENDIYNGSVEYIPCTDEGSTNKYFERLLDLFRQSRLYTDETSTNLLNHFTNYCKSCESYEDKFKLMDRLTYAILGLDSSLIDKKSMNCVASYIIDSLDVMISFLKQPDLNLNDRRAVLGCAQIYDSLRSMLIEYPTEIKPYELSYMLTNPVVASYLRKKYGEEIRSIELIGAAYTKSDEASCLLKNAVAAMNNLAKAPDSFVDTVVAIEDKINNSPVHGVNEIYYCEDLLNAAQAQFDALSADQVDYVTYYPKSADGRNYQELLKKYQDQLK